MNTDRHRWGCVEKAGRFCAITALTALLLASAAHAAGLPLSAERAAAIVPKYKGVFTSPPEVPANGPESPGDGVIDAPLMGNGDLGVCVTGPPEAQRFWISKCDFWKAKPGSGGPRPIGGIDILIPTLKGAAYRAEQTLYVPVVNVSLATAKSKVAVRSWVPAMASLLVIELSVTGEPVEVEVKPWAQTGDGSTADKGAMKGAEWFVRRFKGRDLAWQSEGVVGVRYMGAAGRAFKLEPRKPVTVVAFVMTNQESERCAATVRTVTPRMDLGHVQRAWNVHDRWWREFWSKSYIEIGDPKIEKLWYGSLYVTACGQRNSRFPAGVRGNWLTTDRPARGGGYLLGGSYEAAFRGLYTTNHIVITDGYDSPILEYLARGREDAKKLKRPGVLYPPAIGPMGLDLSAGKSNGRQTNASSAAANMLMRFRFTYDPKYARLIYPFLVEVGNFWESDLRFGNGRYTIHDGNDLNPVRSLGLARMIFEGLIDVSRELGIDAARRKKWRHILDHLAPYPTHRAGGKEIFRLTERGPAWSKTRSPEIEHVWPAGQIGLGSDARLLRIARDTHAALGRWADGAAFPTYYPAAARLGVDPNLLLGKLRALATPSHGRSLGSHRNLLIYGDAGATANAGVVPATINEMLLQSHAGVIRVFPVWPRDRDARFGQLRAYGAFLISSELLGGQVQYVIIESERGRSCTMRSPWPGREVVVSANGEQVGTVKTETFTVKTPKGGFVFLVPKLPVPVVRVKAKTFLKSATVEIVCFAEGGTVRYTLDGSEPTARAPRYQKPFAISKTTTIKARYFAADGSRGDVSETVLTGDRRADD